MRILDVNGNEIKNPNQKKGYLKHEQLLIKHHPAVEAVKPVEEQGHYEVAKVYPNGGQDMEWVIDKPGVIGVPAQPAWDEYENIQRYIEYDAQKQAEIEEAAQNEKKVNGMPKKFDELSNRVDELSKKLDQVISALAAMGVNDGSLDGN